MHSGVSWTKAEYLQNYIGGFLGSLRLLALMRTLDVSGGLDTENVLLPPAASIVSPEPSSSEYTFLTI